jgi:hypothetical protein
MARDVLGLDPYQRSAISCARVGCALALLGFISAVAVFFYSVQVSDGSFQLLSGGLMSISILLLIAARLRLSKEVRHEIHEDHILRVHSASLVCLRRTFHGAICAKNMVVKGSPMRIWSGSR